MRNKLPPLTETQLTRFVASIIQQSDGCWVWGGRLTTGGYPTMHFGARPQKRLAHRVSYEHFVGEVPTDLDLDHLCRNRACVNPCHLEPVTRLENVRRGLMGVLITPEVRERCAAPKRGKPRPWTSEWQAALKESHQRLSREQTHCKNGHLYEPSTTLLHNGWRSCRLCRQEADRRYHQNKRLKDQVA